MKILRIGPPQGRLGYQRVVLDSGAAFRVRPEDVTALGLQAGEELPDEMLPALRARAEGALAAQIAYRLLSVRLRSRRELVDRLRRRGISEDTIQAVMRELEGGGFVDDRRFAEAWVRSRMALHPSGAVRLRYELASRGVPKDVISGALSATLGREEGALALQLVRARFHRYRGAPRDVAYRRLAGILQRRGFSTAVIGAVLRQVLGAPGLGEE